MPHTGLRAKALLAKVGVRVRVFLAGLRAKALLAGVEVRVRCSWQGRGCCWQG